MEALRLARALAEEGDYSRALAALDKSPARASTAMDVARADILESIGRIDEAATIARKVLGSCDTCLPDRAVAEFVLARIAYDTDDIDIAIAGLQRAVALAKRTSNLDLLCWCQIKLLVAVFEMNGREAATPLLAELRRNALTLAKPRAMAAVHVFVGELEAKIGLFNLARRHALSAQKLLVDSRNYWLEGVAENLLLAVSILRSDFDEARTHGNRALELSQRSGKASVLRASLANVGNLYFATGEFEQAIDYLKQAQCIMPFVGHKTNASRETIARILLLQGRFDESREILDRIDASTKSERMSVSYAHRYSALTRARILLKTGEVDAAMARTDFVLDLAGKSQDAHLERLGLLLKCELLLGRDRLSDAIAVLDVAMSNLPGESPELLGEIDRLLACHLRKAGHETAARSYYARAMRSTAALKNIVAVTELKTTWQRSAQSERPVSARRSDTTRIQPVSEDLEPSVLHSFAALVLYPDRAELIAEEVLNLLYRTNAIEKGSAVLCTSDGTTRTIADVSRNQNANDSERCLYIRQPNGTEVRIRLIPTNDVRAASAINAVASILSALEELRQSRVEREQRSALWPPDAVTVDQFNSVISGQIREQMNLARRVAKTSVNVLITGESGTGKEILAKAIHEFSDRAKKPFVPFNCTAVPRDLLESHLFGHRRGAFTGADRDQPGLIRAARDGTLFLDEIGELSLDLQPKLLRFLESGEIAPLGEAGTVKVNVRIVAATNANLEDAVRDGKFREDLFYRLNVVRLSLKPLRERRDEIPGFITHFVARAAEEYTKGHLTVADETLERLLLYRWPGNVRQLQNEIRRMVALAEPDSTLEPEAISEDILNALPIFRPIVPKGKEIAVNLTDKLQPTLQRIECEMIKAAFREHRGKVDAVAKSLGISRKGLYLKRQRLGL